jgi:hypothetical protein
MALHDTTEMLPLNEESKPKKSSNNSSKNDQNSNKTFLTDSTSKLYKSFANKTKLSLSNSSFNISLILNLVDCYDNLSQSEIKNEYWWFKMSIILILFILQITVFGMIFSFIVVKDKVKMEKINNITLFLSMFILLFEIIKKHVNIR